MTSPASPRFLRKAGCILFATLGVTASAIAHDSERSTLVLTSTNDPGGNQVVVFELSTRSMSELSLLTAFPTGGKGGASNNAGILQFDDDIGAVANYGSNTVTRIVRHHDWVGVRGTIELTGGCTKPDSVALAQGHLFVAGATCVESHAWPSGAADGEVVRLSDPSAAQVVVGKTWGAVTLASGSLLQLDLRRDGGLSGRSSASTLPSGANNTPLGAAFWRNTLGFTPAHSPDSFAIVNAAGEVFPVAGPTPPFPGNATCWVAKGPGNVWYTGNSPGQAISVFFSDDRGGVFYKSVPVPGVPTDVAVSPDQKWLVAIYTSSGSGYVAAFRINAYGDVALAATSSPMGVPAFNGVAISQ